MLRGVRRVSGLRVGVLLAVVLCIPPCILNAAETMAGSSERALAREILKAADLKGGLIVHVGCGEGKLAAELCAGDSYLVHGLDPDANNIEQARKHIQSAGLYGKVSVEQWTSGCLPYTDNLVNLLVSEDPGKVSMEEVMRVLVPRGVAYIRGEGKWTKTVKLWPREIDEWTHYLHDATGNAVAKDTLVGPPRHLQWVAKPLYCRSHEIDTSVCALVSARGHVFYILDEGLPGIIDERLPARWSLVARDAFNGVLLWKRPIPRWGWREWKENDLAGKDWTGLRGQRTRSPIVLPRRLVADGDRLYVTLGYEAPLSVLDAATGQIVQEFQETEGTDEILSSQGVLVLCIRTSAAEKAKRRGGEAAPQSILAIQADTGEILWREQADRILPFSLAVGGDRVFFHNFSEIVCLDLKTGNELWRAPSQAPKGSLWGVPTTLVVHEQVVLFLSPKKLEALSAETGKTLWTAPGSKGPGVSNPPDLFVADGLVWYGGPTRRYDTRSWLAEGPMDTIVDRIGYDPVTGQVKRRLEIRNLISPGHHFRCYRSKATERYILWPKRGVEFLDLKSDNHARHDWLRPPCKLGFMPCNGLLYMPPHQCFCYPGVKLSGFNALAPKRESKPAKQEGRDDSRLERGPAYTQIRNPQSAIRNPDDWPTYRHDPKRSGSTSSTVPFSVVPLWQSELGGKITPPVVAGEKLFVASVDTHTIHALDAHNGRPLWSYTTAGRVDSPPTLYEGLALVGSADGWVYCLRASDGELVWRFRAAPEDRRVVAFEQLESAWPVHGSVLVKDGVAYFAAGRSSFLDGGIYVYGLDPKTGKKLHEARLDGPHPDSDKDIGRPFDMEGTFSDVLVTDGTYLYMQQVVLDSSLKEHEAPRITKMGDRRFGRHLFSTAGFLDDTWWNRTFWMYSERWPGFYITNQSPKAGQILVFDNTTTYGVKCYTTRNRHSPMFFPGKEGYLLFADDNETEPVLVDKTGNPRPVKWLPEVNEAIGHTLYDTSVDRDKGTGFTRAQPPQWSEWVPVRIRAMVVADKALFVAGPPDVLDPDDPLGAFEGRKGAMLWAVSAADGEKLAEYMLESTPVFDGMIAAAERLYLSTKDGTVLCFGGG